MRKTKIICTIGPATQDEDTLKGLCKAGMNVARLNFSHNTHEDHQKRIDSIKRVREELDMWTILGLCVPNLNGGWM